MRGSWWLDLLLGLAAGLLLAWVVLLVALVIARPRGGLLREALRLLPDLLRLLPRLAADSSLPRGTRIELALLLVYLAFPFDLVPDFIPVLGYADDAIIVAAVLRRVVRRAGVQALQRQWPGTDDGFAVLPSGWAGRAWRCQPSREAPGPRGLTQTGHDHGTETGAAA